MNFWRDSINSVDLHHSKTSKNYKNATFKASGNGPKDE